MKIAKSTYELMKKEIQNRLGYKEFMSREDDKILTLSLYKTTTTLKTINIKVYTRSEDGKRT